MPVKVVRIFNTYGPRMRPDDGRVVSNFIVQALRGDPITIYGDGMQTRSFCYVDDLIDGILAMMDTHENVTGPVNVGNPNEFTMLNRKVTVDETGSKSILSSARFPRMIPSRESLIFLWPSAP